MTTAILSGQSGMKFRVESVGNVAIVSCSYIEFVVKRDSLHSNSSLFSADDVPGDVGPYTQEASWYVAARYTYGEYNSNVSGRSFALGDDSVTKFRSVTYHNQRLEAERKYFVYVRVVRTHPSEVSDPKK